MKVRDPPRLSLNMTSHKVDVVDPVKIHYLFLQIQTCSTDLDTIKDKHKLRVNDTILAYCRHG